MKPNEAATPQTAPVANECPHIADLVIEDILARKAEGVRKYGTPLQAGNGRDALMDAYQEALDLAQYLKQAIEDRSMGSDEKDHPPMLVRAQLAIEDIRDRAARDVETFLVKMAQEVDLWMREEKDRAEYLRREGAVAALLMLADQCWHDRDVVLRLKSRIEAGEVTPWAK